MPDEKYSRRDRWKRVVGTKRDGLEVIGWVVLMLALIAFAASGTSNVTQMKAGVLFLAIIFAMACFAVFAAVFWRHEVLKFVGRIWSEISRK